MKRMGILLAVALATSCAEAVESERVDLGRGVALEIVRIPSGNFEMGSPANEKGRGPDEDAHRVELAESFWMSRCPVTRGQFARFVQETGYRSEAETGTSGGFGFDGTTLVQRKEFNWRNPGFEQTDEHPVVLVTHGDALAFARWLSQKSTRTVSLPSEAQWEYACRAGTTTRYYSGDADEDAGLIAWHKENAGKGTKPVAGKQANAFGLYDMCGNVYQWCADTYAPYLPGGGVQGPMDKPRRVLRGGSWLKGAQHVRSAARARSTPGSRNADNGFRVVLGPAAVVPPPAVEAPAIPPSSSGSSNAAASPATVESESPAAPVTPSVPPGPAALSTPGGTRNTDNSQVSVIFVLLIVLLIGVIGVALLYFLVKKLASPSTDQQRMLEDTTPRVEDDGFWFDTTGYRAGDVVTYSYMGPGGRVSERFEVEPSSRGQFIYTGVRPSDVVLAGLLADEAERHRRVDPPPQPREHPSADNEDHRFRGHPSAY